MDTEETPDPAAAVDDAVIGGPDFNESAGCIRLGDYRDADMLTKAGMAKVFHCSPRTLQRMIERSDLPPPSFLAGRSVWRVGNLNEWMADGFRARLEEARKQAKRIQRL